MSMKLHVGNLSFQTSNDELEILFSQVGTVESASVVEDRETGRSRGFGFVEMASREEGRPILRQTYRNFGLSCRTEKRRFDHSGGHTMPHRLDSDLELDRRPFFEMRCAHSGKRDQLLQGR